MKKTILYLTCLLSFFITQAQNQIGADIDGEAPGDVSGESVSISADGRFVAVGATGNTGNGAQAGHVRVFERVGNNWSQLGADIDGEAAGDQSGRSVSLSSDGTRVAIGANTNGGNGLSAGHVRVFELVNGNWVQLGGDIDGEAAGVGAGVSVSLSSDGSRVAIAGIFLGGRGLVEGYVQVYEWSNGAWTQLGANIESATGENFGGNSLSFSSDGNKLAIGYPSNSGIGVGSGNVRVFEWSNGSWTQLGSDIEGEAKGDNFGQSVSLSSNGNRVAIGAPFNDGAAFNAGHVQVYEWDNGSWTQLGSDIGGEAAFDQSGGSVSLSSDGSKLAIGARLNDGNGNSSGHVRIFELIGGNWVQIGDDIDGEAEGDQTGFSVALSSDGGTLAIGAYLNDGNGLASGHVRVYGGLCTGPQSSFTFLGNMLDVTFTDASTTASAITSWEWDFGDGNTSTLQNPMHTYASFGSYAVSLIVEDACTKDTFTQVIGVSDCDLPAGFVGVDIGDVSGNAGKACQDANGVVEFNSAGTGIKGLADGFHYVYKSHSGDIDMIVRVATIPNNSARRAGLMLRTGTGTNAENVSLLINGKKEVKLSKRSSEGGITITTATKFAKKRQNTYLRLTYDNATHTILAYYSRSGVSTSWQLVGISALTLPTNYLAGMATTRGQSGNTVLFRLDNLQIDGTSLRLSASPMIFHAAAYPNPFGDRLSYRLEGLQTDATVRLLDLNGRVIAVEVLDSNASTVGSEGVLDTSQLASGMYLLEVRANGERKLVKVVKR